jgi:hypothetical protein
MRRRGQRKKGGRQREKRRRKRKKRKKQRKKRKRQKKKRKTKNKKRRKQQKKKSKQSEETKKAEEEKKKAEEEAKKKEEETLKKENETLKTEEKAERDDAKAMARAIREKIEAQLAEQFPIEPVKTSSKPKSAATEDTEAPSNSENKAKEGGDKEAGEAQQEDDDSHGTKKMKSDFDAKMIAMEQEMSAGRSKLAKLRERIRKAKGVVKEADTALDDSKKS